MHRDLKPSNTFVTYDAREPRAVVKLLDFGLAKLAVADGIERTASGVVIGTARYLSPEQARGPNVDGRSDIYALGCVAYEVVLGHYPFPEARTPTAAIAARLTEPPPQPRTIVSRSRRSSSRFDICTMAGCLSRSLIERTTSKGL